MGKCKERDYLENLVVDGGQYKMDLKGAECGRQLD